MPKDKAAMQKKELGGGHNEGIERGSGQRSGGEAICIPFAPHLYPLLHKNNLLFQ
jgi:hypothetical protein